MKKEKTSVWRTVLIVILCLLLAGGAVGLVVRLFKRHDPLPSPEDPPVLAEHVELDKSEIIF